MADVYTKLLSINSAHTLVNTPHHPIHTHVHTTYHTHVHTHIGGGCVFITAGPITKLFAGGGGGEWTTCAMIDDEPRPVWMSPLVTHCGFPGSHGQRKPERR